MNFNFIALAHWLPELVIFQNNKLPKLCPINMLLVSTSEFSLQAAVHLLLCSLN